MSPEREDRIDAAIDDVARGMTEGAPGADFKARVLARIDESATSQGGRRLAWLVSPLAVAALLVIAALLWRGSPVQKDVARGVQSNQGRSTTSAEVTAVKKPALGDELTLRQAQGERGVEGPDATGNSVRLGRNPTRRLLRPSELDTLAPPPLQVDSIALSEIPPVRSIEVPRPEAIAPIALAPLGEGDRP